MTAATIEFPTDNPRTAGGRLSFVIRPIRPADEPLMTRFHQALSAESVYTRYFNALKLSRRTAHERLCRVCCPDPGGEAVLVAETAAPSGGGPLIIGVGRLSVIPGAAAAEVALVVADSYQGRGVGSELLGRLIGVARRRGLARITARLLAGNGAMRRLCAAAGMRLSDRPAGEVEGVLEL